MNRQLLLPNAGVLILSAATLLTGCGDSSAPSSPTSVQTASPEIVLWHVNGIIAENHGHKVTASMAQVMNGVPVSLPLFGNPRHAHVVELSPEELTEIGDGGRVVTTSSPGGGHTHAVSFGWRDNLR